MGFNSKKVSPFKASLGPETMNKTPERSIVTIGLRSKFSNNKFITVKVKIIFQFQLLFLRFNLIPIKKPLSTRTKKFTYSTSSPLVLKG